MSTHGSRKITAQIQKLEFIALSQISLPSQESVPPPLPPGLGRSSIKGLTYLRRHKEPYLHTEPNTGMVLWESYHTSEVPAGPVDTNVIELEEKIRQRYHNLFTDGFPSTEHYQPEVLVNLGDTNRPQEPEDPEDHGDPEDMHDIEDMEDLDLEGTSELFDCIEFNKLGPVYNVMLIMWEDGVAYREGIGRCYVDVFNRGQPIIEQITSFDTSKAFVGWF